MALTPQHTYQILTKRPERMAVYFNDPQVRKNIYSAAHYGENAILEKGFRLIYNRLEVHDHTWPLPNVWLGVSVEDQRTASVRIPLLLQTPAAVRFLSIEPLLGPVDLTNKGQMCGSYLARKTAGL